MDDLIDVFLEEEEPRDFLTRFDREMQRVSAINVFSRPFPVEWGFDTFHNGRFSLLLLRLESLDLCGEQALKEFLGIPKARLKRFSEEAGRWYEDAYREFKARLVLPDTYLDGIYDSKFARHFYAPDELKAFRARWSKKQQWPAAAA